MYLMPKLNCRWLESRLGSFMPINSLHILVHTHLLEIYFHSEIKYYTQVYKISRLKEFEFWISDSKPGDVRV